MFHIVIERSLHERHPGRRLLRLAEGERDAGRAGEYRHAAERILQSPIDGYLTPAGVLRHGSSTGPRDEILIYGDYNLLESPIAAKLKSRFCALTEL